MSGTYGTRIPVRNMLMDAANKKFKSEKQVNEAVDACIEYLESNRQLIIDKFLESSECEHDFGKPTYSIQGRVIGFVTVYQRSCKACGYSERQTKESEGEPEWAEGANQTYYNNNF